MTHTSPSTLVAALCALLWALLCPPLAHGQAQQLPVIDLTAGGQALTAEVAATPNSRRYGLMHRKQLPDNHGMLFVFEQDDIYCFWMKNTPLPLTVAFINSQGAIINLANMQPNTTHNHCAHGAARYALEMQQGWFDEHNIGPGAVLSGLPDAP